MAARLAFAVAFIGVQFAWGGDTTGADVEKAKAVHKKELERLRKVLLDTIDKIIKQENDNGRPIDYLLKERRGFEANGVPPLLPKLLDASKEYTAGQRTADGVLIKALESASEAYSRAGQKKEAAQLQDELARLKPRPKPTGPVVETKDDLRNFLTSTSWVWNKGGIVSLKPDGVVSHPGWDSSGWIMKWEAVDRRIFKMTITKGSGTGGTATGRIAVLQLTESLSEFAGRDFDGTTIQSSPRKN
jgi:hypothetical protein